MGNDNSIKNEIATDANEIAKALDADVILHCGDIERGSADTLIRKLIERKRRENVFLIMVTYGGDASAAYRIARTLQEYYTKYIAFIPSYCKSAGTLCILGAHEIVMDDSGELGPLDVQLYKKDEIGELSSGLVAYEALQVLQDKAFNMFEKYFMTIKIRSQGQITFKTATETAIKMSIGLLEPLYRQIDPFQIGEIVRSLKVADAYGSRLMLRSKNYTKETLKQLSESYPTHGFVIDRSEAMMLFKNIRIPTSTEAKLSRVLSMSDYISQDICVEFLSEEYQGDNNGDKAKNASADKAKQVTTKKTKRGSNKKRDAKNSK